MEIDKLIKEYEDKLLTIKKRYYYVSDFLKELEKRTGRRRFDIKNDIIWQMITDSYSMLVIDLASLYKNLGEQGGFFGLLKNHSAKLRRTSYRKIDVDGQHYQKMIADNIEKKLISLFPHLKENPDQSVTHDHIDELKKKILDRAEEVHNDRDNIRAHRYQKGEVDKASSQGIQITQLGKHFEYLEDFLNALRLVTLQSTLAYDDMNHANATVTAEDVVDMILMGGIQGIFRKFGVPKALERTSGPQYYHQFRDNFYQADPAPFGKPEEDEE